MLRWFTRQSKSIKKKVGLLFTQEWWVYSNPLYAELNTYSQSQSVLLTKENIDNIKGRVLLQTLPSEAYNTDGTLAHGRLYAREFAKVGIPTARYCLKIPSTGPALVAARILESEGIHTLGTALFGLPQAIACSQAGCWAISPYYNGRVLTAPLADPAAEHPMSPRLVQILDIYKRLYLQTGKEQPLMKLARYISAHILQ